MKFLLILAVIPLAGCGGGEADPPKAEVAYQPPVDAPLTSTTTLQITRPMTYYIPGDTYQRFVALYPPDQIYASQVNAQGDTYVFRGTLVNNLFSGLWCEVTADVTYPLGEFAATVSVDSNGFPVLDASNVGFTWSNLEPDPTPWMGDEPLCVDMVFP